MGCLEGGRWKAGCGLCRASPHWHLHPLNHHPGDSLSSGLSSLPSETWGATVGMSSLCLPRTPCRLQAWAVIKTSVPSHAEGSSARALLGFCLEIHVFRVSKDIQGFGVVGHERVHLNM